MLRQQKQFPAEERHNRLRLVASRDADGGSLRIHQDARIYLSNLEDNKQVSHTCGPGSLPRAGDMYI